MSARVFPLWALALVACVLAACQAADERRTPVAAPAAPRAEAVAAVVESLLARVAGSGLVFIRNGREHTAAEATKHIRGKYEHFRDDIRTPEDFIDKAATKSQLSGKPYLVKLPDGTTRWAADWLRELLAEYRAPA